MQQDADFITVDFLYMFRASYAHQQLLTGTYCPTNRTPRFIWHTKNMDLGVEYGLKRMSEECNLETAYFVCTSLVHGHTPANEKWRGEGGQDKDGYTNTC